MPAASRNLLLLCAGLCFALTFGAFLVYERPGLGLGHFYYLGIALAAMAVGPRLGIAAGFVATALYASGVVLNPHLQSDEVLRLGTLTRAFTYVTIGGLIGWFAGRNRSMLEELRVLAERDSLTGLPNTRAFEAAITQRLGRPVRAPARRHGCAQGLQPRRGLRRGQRSAAAARGSTREVVRARRRRGAGRERRVRGARVGTRARRWCAGRGAPRARAGRRTDEGDARLGRVPERRRQRARALPGGE